MPRSVAVVSTVYPYPTDSGKKVVLRGVLDYWRDRVGDDNVHHVVVCPPGTVTNEPPFPVHELAKPTGRRQLWSLARTTLAQDKSLQEAVLWCPRVRGALADVLARIGAEVEIYDTVRLGQYAASCSAVAPDRRVIYLDDLFSVRYEKMLAHLDSEDPSTLRPLGAFGGMIPASLGRMLSSPRVARAALSMERRLIAKSEDAAAREFSQSLLVNRHESDRLRGRAGTDSVRTIAPLVSAPRGRPRRFDGKARFVFLGLLSLPHNAESLRHFLTHHVEEAAELMPGFHLHVVGRDADDDILSLAGRHRDHVTMEGYVDDLDDLLAEACALLSPLQFGSGVKLKILEALARGLPVLSTSVGVEGIASGTDEGCVVVDDLEQYPKWMHYLTDPGTNETLSAAASRFYAETFAPDVVYASYDRLFA